MKLNRKHLQHFEAHFMRFKATIKMKCIFLWQVIHLKINVCKIIWPKWKVMQLMWLFCITSVNWRCIMSSRFSCHLLVEIPGDSFGKLRKNQGYGMIFKKICAQRHNIGVRMCLVVRCKLFTKVRFIWWNFIFLSCG